VPLNALVGFDGVVIDPPDPLTVLHDPVPAVGVLPASVVLVRLQSVDPVWSVPAFAVVGFWLKVTVTSSVEAVQGGLLIVQRNTYVVPAVPENGLSGFAGALTVPPDPLTMLHDPVPDAGELPVSFVLVSPHKSDPVRSVPAFAVVGNALIVM
jgi:hypothetical protein